MNNYKKKISADQMTPNERAAAMAAGKEVDRMPIFMFAGMVVPTMIGMTKREAEESAKNLARVEIEGYRIFGYDGVGVSHGLFSLAIALGGEYTQPEHSTRILTKTPISDVKDVSKLDMEKVGLKKDKIAAKAFDVIRYLQDEIGDEVDCNGIGIASPFTAAAGIVGVENLLRAIAKEPEKAKELLQFAEDAQFKLASDFIKEGIGISTSDPVASCALISPKKYREFAQPYEKSFAARCAELTKGSMAFHICGNTTPILNDIADCGFWAYALDNKVDLEVAKNTIGDRMYLMGNVDPVDVMLRGSESDVRSTVRECFRKAWNSPKGFCIGTGCDLSYGTPERNLFAYMDEARECAIEQAKAYQRPKEQYVWDEI